MNNFQFMGANISKLNVQEFKRQEDSAADRMFFIGNKVSKVARRLKKRIFLNLAYSLYKV